MLSIATYYVLAFSAELHCASVLRPSSLASSSASHVLLIRFKTCSLLLILFPIMKTADVNVVLPTDSEQACSFTCLLQHLEWQWFLAFRSPQVSFVCRLLL